MALFIVGLVFALVTLHSHRPIRRPSPLVIPAWLASWPVIELAPQLLIIEAAVAAALATMGGLSSDIGLAGLALTVVSCIGLALHVALALQTSKILDTALGEFIPALEGTQPTRQPRWQRWRQLALAWPMRPPRVERIRGNNYNDNNKSPRATRRSAVDVFRPTNLTTDAKRPVLLFVHGGGWVVGDKKQQGLLTVHEMASRGWVCVSMNYRLSPRATFPDQLIDVKRALKWVKENIAVYGGNPEFVVICGGSAGAHLSALAALTANHIEFQRDFAELDTTVQGCVGYYGVYDFKDRYDHWPHGGLRLILERAIMKCRIADAEAAYDKASPMSHVGPHAPPMFLLHGDRDNLAPPEESRRFAELLRAVSQQPVLHAELPGAQHAFELLASVRSLAAVDAVGTFCETLYAAHCERGGVDHSANAN